MRYDGKEKTAEQSESRAWFSMSTPNKTIAPWQHTGNVGLAVAFEFTQEEMQTSGKAQIDRGDASGQRGGCSRRFCLRQHPVRLENELFGVAADE
jgi:hypothetical protein